MNNKNKKYSNRNIRYCLEIGLNQIKQKCLHLIDTFIEETNTSENLIFSTRPPFSNDYSNDLLIKKKYI